MAQAIFAELASVLFWVILVVFNFLEYMVAVRPFIKKKYGTHVSGFFDGVIVTLLIMALAFYVESFFVG